LASLYLSCSIMIQTFSRHSHQICHTKWSLRESRREHLMWFSGEPVNKFKNIRIVFFVDRIILFFRLSARQELFLVPGHSAEILKIVFIFYFWDPIESKKKLWSKKNSINSIIEITRAPVAFRDFQNSLKRNFGWRRTRPQCACAYVHHFHFIFFLSSMIMAFIAWTYLMLHIIFPYKKYLIKK